jgi:hypothetical protein
VSPLISFACIVSSFEKNIPDSDMPSSVALRVTAAVFVTPQAIIAAKKMHDTTLHEVENNLNEHQQKAYR